MSELRLGIIGMSRGNGHPYSWSAIFNGYDPEAMRSCPFPAIPTYLARRSFPADAIEDATVTHLWTQERAVSRQIASASRIRNVVDEPDEMIGEIDALLLARDDAEMHEQLAKPFLRAGLPVYIDKPLALSLADAERLLGERRHAGQIFTCSALRYAPELRARGELIGRLGRIKRVRGWTPNAWRTYAPHVIEPALAMLGVAAGEPERISACTDQGRTTVKARWSDGEAAELTALGASSDAGIGFEVIGDRASAKLAFSDSFTAFKLALEAFVAIAEGRSEGMNDAQLLAPVRIIEAGLAGRTRP